MRLSKKMCNRFRMLLVLMAVTSLDALAQEQVAHRAVEINPTHVWVGAHDGLIYNMVNIAMEGQNFSIQYVHFRDAKKEADAIHAILSKAVKERKAVRIDLDAIAKTRAAKLKEFDRVWMSVATRSPVGMMAAQLPSAGKLSEAFQVVEDEK